MMVLLFEAASDGSGLEENPGTVSKPQTTHVARARSSKDAAVMGEPSHERLGLLPSCSALQLLPGCKSPAAPQVVGSGWYSM